MSRTFTLQDGVLMPSEPESKADSAQTLAPGAVIDSKYKIISLLGQGGMGAVYHVYHLLLDKEMALKTFRSRQIEKDAAQRFELEARAIAKLSHKNIVQVFDFGVTEGRPFYTMELLSGYSLVTYIKERKLSLRETLEIFIEVADGLAHAHKAGIIHRDIKPDNIHLGQPKGKAGKISSVKIVDFGIAKLAIESTVENTEDPSSQKEQALTRVGRIFGSPLYMSPEQSTGLPTDHTTDIYSLGCTFFEAITGRPPFVGKDSRATLSCHRLEPAPTLAQVASDRVFPQRLEGLIARMLKKDSRERIQSCVEIRRELARILALLADTKGLPASSIATPRGGAHMNIVGQAKTDPLIAADRALSKAIEERPRVVIAAATVIVALLVTLSVWWSWSFSIFDGGSGKNKKAAVPSIGFPDTKSAMETPSALTAQKMIDCKPPAKFLVQQTKTTKTFRFPLREPIGMLYFDDKEVPAVGEVAVPRRSECRLEADRPVALHPSELAGFGPDDLKELGFGRLYNWGDENLKWAAKLTGLTKLDVANCDITDASIDYINALSNLQELNISGGKIGATQWCRLRRLPELKVLRVEDIKNTLALLSKLKRSNSLEDLELLDSDMSDVGMTYVATFKKLTRFKLANSTVTTKGLQALRNLPELHYLCLSRCKIGPDSIPTLLDLRNLVELEIETDSWGLGNQARLEQTMQARHKTIKQTTPHGRND